VVAARATMKYSPGAASTSRLSLAGLPIFATLRLKDVDFNQQQGELHAQYHLYHRPNRGGSIHFVHAGAAIKTAA